jgi:putative ABC transport system permease protein
MMLATGQAQVREIGIHKAVGATHREIKCQFLAEAIFISLAGGFVGMVVGLGLPLMVRWFSDYRIPMSGLFVVVAVLVSSLVRIYSAQRRRGAPLASTLSKVSDLTESTGDAALIGRV